MAHHMESKSRGVKALYFFEEWKCKAAVMTTTTASITVAEEGKTYGSGSSIDPLVSGSKCLNMNGVPFYTCLDTRPQGERGRRVPDPTAFSTPIPSRGRIRLCYNDGTHDDSDPYCVKSLFYDCKLGAPMATVCM